MKLQKPGYLVLTLLVLLTLLVSPAASAHREEPALPAPQDVPGTPLSPGLPAVKPGIYMKDDTSFYYGTADPQRYHLDGNVYNWTWSYLETSMGSYNTSRVDRLLRDAAAKGKRGAFAISPYGGGRPTEPGVQHLPAYMWDTNNYPPATVDQYTYEICKYVAPACDQAGANHKRLPYYWRDAFVDRYQALANYLASRYRNDARLEFIAMGFGTYGENHATNQPEDKYAMERAMLADGITSFSGGWISYCKYVMDIWRNAFSTYDPGSGQQVLRKQLLVQIASFSWAVSERRDLGQYAADRGIGISLNGLTPDFNFAEAGDMLPTCPNCGMYDVLNLHNDRVPAAFETYWYMLQSPTKFYWGLISGLDKHAYYLRLDESLFITNGAPGPGHPYPGPNGTDRTDYLPIIDRWRPYVGATLANTPSVWVAMRDHRNPIYYDYAFEWWSYFPQLGNFEFWLYQMDDVAGGRTVPESNDPFLSSDPNVNPASRMGNCGGGTPCFSPNYVFGLGNCAAAAGTGPAYCNTNAYNPNIPAGREGWVARRTDEATGNPYMWLRVHPNYIPVGRNTVDISVTYADMGTDTWALEYEAVGSVLRQATPNGASTPYVQKTNSGTWKTAVFHITDARMGKGLRTDAGAPTNSDFRINARGDGNEWIHLVDVKLLNTEPEPTATPTPTATMTPTPGPTSTATPTPTATPTVGSIQGTVYNDANQNMQRDPEEGSLAGAIVTLRRSGQTLATVTTGANGLYSFPNLAAGQYEVQETDPPGYTSTTLNSWLLVVGANTALTQDFGDVEMAKVQGRVFVDGNGNGVYDTGEAGVRQVPIRLYQDANGNGTLDPGDPQLAERETGGAGNYTFTTLTPGSYLVKVLSRSGYPVVGNTVVSFNITLAEVISADFATTREVYVPVFWR